MFEMNFESLESFMRILYEKHNEIYNETNNSCSKNRQPDRDVIDTTFTEITDEEGSVNRFDINN